MLITNVYTIGIMTNPKYSVIVKQEEKADRCVHGKEGIQMNAIMISSYLKHERYENALDRKQSLVSVYTFLKKRNHMFQEKTGTCRGLC